MFKAMYACCIVNVELEFEHGGGGTGAYVVCPLESEFELHPFGSIKDELLIGSSL
jgi:hypothetical protein